MNTAKDAEGLRGRLKAEGKSRAEIIRALMVCCLGWPYVFSAAGEMCTPEWRRNRISYCREQKYADMIRNNCPVLSQSLPLGGKGGPQSGSEEVTCIICKWYGALCFDCRGFTRWLLAQAGVPLYGDSVTTQWETASNWAAKGTIDTLPRGLVCCVFRPKHTGMYQGNGNVIHCSGSVKQEPLPGKPNWERWGIPAGLYTTDELRKEGIHVNENKNTPTLRRGDQLDAVVKLQALLNAKYTADLEIDGLFGAKTEEAVRTFQKAHGLKADGICGPKTWAALGVKDEPLVHDNTVGHKEDEAPENALVSLDRGHLIELKARLSDALNIVNSALAGSD